jgi:outer membrane receptor for ferrienterochelin and colicin
MNPRLYRVRLASLAAQLSLCGCALAQGPEAHTDPTDMAYPVVITPTRLRQSLADVPASVTIITADTLRRYGITSIPEAMRLVPGMAVTHVSGNNDRVNYHGADQLGATRLNVLIDGVSASNELRHDRTDLIISHGFSLGAMPSSATLTMSYLDNPVVNINRPSVGYYTSGNDNRLNVRGALRLAF